MNKRLAIITSHPIQYNAPLFALLSSRKLLAIKVFYTWGESVLQNKYDRDFDKIIEWNIPLLEGYHYEFVTNNSLDPGSHHFRGIVNPTLCSILEKWDPDAILIYGWAFQSHLKVLRWFKGKRKILFRGDSNLIDEPKGFSIRKFVRRQFLTWVYTHVNTALYVGSANKEYYLKHNLKKEQLAFAPHSIDNNRFKGVSSFNRRKSIGISATAIVFLFAGKFESKKDPLLLLNCFVSLNNFDTHLVMVGSGTMEEELKAIARAQSFGIRDRIHFLPFQNQLQMPEIYSLADVFVLPSKGPGETWGLSVNEAMACGKAVLVSDKCGCANDLVQDGLNGFVFKSQDRDDLLSKMKILTESQERLSQMGNKSLQLIQSWNYEKICIAIENQVIHSM